MQGWIARADYQNAGLADDTDDQPGFIVKRKMILMIDQRAMKDRTRPVVEIAHLKRDEAFAWHVLTGRIGALLSRRQHYGSVCWLLVNLLQDAADTHLQTNPHGGLSRLEIAQPHQDLDRVGVFRAPSRAAGHDANILDPVRTYGY